MLHGTRGALGGTGALTACVRCAAGGYGRGAILQGGESEACCARAVGARTAAAQLRRDVAPVTAVAQASGGVHGKSRDTCGLCGDVVRSEGAKPGCSEDG